MLSSCEVCPGTSCRCGECGGCGECCGVGGVERSGLAKNDHLLGGKAGAHKPGASEGAGVGWMVVGVCMGEGKERQ